MKRIINEIKLAWKWNKTTKTLLFFLCLFLLCLFVVFFKDISEYFFKDDNTSKGELLKVFLTFTAGIVAVFVWHTSYKRAKATEKQIKVMEKGNVESRFNNAVGHLGNENSAIVLAGIHVLHQIAVEYNNYTQIVHNLFCSYLRENSAKLYENIDFEKTFKCPVIIQTLIDYLFKPYNNKDSIYKNYKSNLSFSTLINCDFGEIEINDANFSDCILEKCNYYKSNLAKCFFRVGLWINVVLMVQF